MPNTQVTASATKRVVHLGDLAAIPSVAGYFLQMQQYLIETVTSFGLHGRALSSGEVLVMPRSTQTPRLLLLAHHDEVGFLVRQREGDFAWLDPVGSVNLDALTSTSLDIHTVSGVARGVMRSASSSFPSGPFPADPLQRQKTGSAYVELFSHEATLDDVQVGDPVTFTPTYFESGSKLVSKALDNRAGLYATLLALADIDVDGLEVAVAFTTAEELGGVSCSQLVRRISPSLVVNVDATLCGDLPNGDLELTDVVQGHGVALKCRDATTVTSVPLRRAVSSLAASLGISTQTEVLAQGGTDARGVMLGNGALMINLGLPVRHLHTPRETVDAADIEHTSQLLVALAREGASLAKSAGAQI